MTLYISAAIPQDRAAIKQTMIDAYQAALPGAAVDPGTPIDVLLDTWAGFYAQLGEQATEVTDAVFRRYGQVIARNPPIDATYATGTITVTAVGGTGGTIDVGTEVSLDPGAGLDRVLFQVTTSTTVAAGATVTGIPIMAVEPGADASGLSADPQFEVTLTTGGVGWVSTVTVPAVTTGGQDAEDDTVYVNRLADEFPLQAITIVRADDAARLARNTTGISSALPLDLYDASTSTAGVGGHLTVAVRADNGGVVASPIKTALQALIASRSSADLITHVIDPTYTTVTIVFVGVAATGYTASDVQARAIAALQALISPANWGVPSFGDQRIWIDTPIVRRQDVITALNTVEGFAYFTTLTINGSSTADLTLTGPAALPAVLPTSSVSGTVT